MDKLRSCDVSDEMHDLSRIIETSMILFGSPEAPAKKLAFSLMEIALIRVKALHDGGSHG
jgi:hypothetical protein